VLARLVRNAHRYDDPGTGVALQEVTWHENLISKPVLAVAVGKADGEGARHSSPSRSAWRDGSGSGHGGKGAVGCYMLSVPRYGRRECCRCSDALSSNSRHLSPSPARLAATLGASQAKDVKSRAWRWKTEPRLGPMARTAVFTGSARCCRARPPIALRWRRSPKTRRDPRNLPASSRLSRASASQSFPSSPFSAASTASATVRPAAMASTLPDVIQPTSQPSNS